MILSRVLRSKKSAMEAYDRSKIRLLLGALCTAVPAAILSGCGGDTQNDREPGGPLLIVVSPHEDDETIMAGGRLYRAAHDGRTRIELIFLSAGEAAGFPGACQEESEAEKERKIRELREEETRAACGVLGIGPSQIHFLGYPDRGLVADSWFSDGKRADLLNEAGEQALAGVKDLLPELVPPHAESLTVITGSFWDAHPDHRVAYQAARAAAEIVRAQRDIPVTILHAIVHDEIPVDIDYCCLGDLHWPNPGPRLDPSALADFPERPRPPIWDLVQDVTDLVSVRTEALNQHESQVNGWPELCMVVFLKRYYLYWMEKTEEAFFREIL